MYKGQIKHFFHGGENGILSYIDSNNQHCEIFFYRQECKNFMPIRLAKGRGWKYGDIVEFDIEMYNDKPTAVFKKFVGNPLLEDLQERLGESKEILGYFYKRDNVYSCTLREKTTGIEFLVKHTHVDLGRKYPENGTLMAATIRKWDTLTCVVNGLDKVK